MQTFILSVMTVAVFFFDDTNFVISSILHVRNYPCLPCTKNKHSVIILKCIFVKIIQILLIINIPLISKNFITNIIVDQNMLTKVYYFPTRFSICLPDVKIGWRTQAIQNFNRHFMLPYINPKWILMMFAWNRVTEVLSHVDCWQWKVGED